jgi:N-methylhydantoinase A
MLAADVTRDTSQTLMADLATLAPTTIAAVMHTQAEEVIAALVADGEQAAHCRVEYELELRYRGQSHELTVPISNRSITEVDLTTAAAHFHELHERRYGHAMVDRPIEAVLLRARGISPRPPLELAVDRPARPGPLSAQATVLACLADDPQPTAAALYHRDDLRFGDQFNGPAVVVQLDATTIIPPNWQAYVDRDLNLVVTHHV